MKTNDPNANFQTLSASGNVAAALSLLSETLDEEQERINKEGSKAMLDDDYETAKLVISFAERLQAFQYKAATLAREWKALEEYSSTTTPGARAVLAKGIFGRTVKGANAPKGAKPAGNSKADAKHQNIVASEQKPTAAKGFYGRAGKGEITPDKAYCPFVLQALVKMGGSAPAKVIKKMVRESMDTTLKPADDETTNSRGRPIRWQVGCGYARKMMVGEKDGRMVNRRDGIWEISEKGRKWLKDNADK